MESLFIKNGIYIPASELEITTSRASGPGGQHVNKSDTRITIRWNIQRSNVLNQKQKELLIKNLQPRLTFDGDLIIHNSESRSQLQNKKLALMKLAQEVRNGLYIPKKRKATQVTKKAKESRLHSKLIRSQIKRNRTKKHYDD